MEQREQPVRFDFAWSDAYHPTYRFGRSELSEARNISINPKQYPGSFRIRNHTWDAALYEIFLSLFDHFASKNIIWEELHLFLMSTYDTKSWTFIRPLLRRASSLGIYRKLRVEMQLLFGPQNPPDASSEFLLEGIHLNENLRAIELTSNQTSSSDSFEIIGAHQFQMTEGDCTTLNRLLETTECLRELSLNGIGMLQSVIHPDEEEEGGEEQHAWDHLLCQGFAKNTSLRKIVLDFVGCPMTDGSLARLVKSISQIPTLESLTLCLPCQTGPLTSSAMQDLLASCQNLTNLELSGPVSFSSSNLEDYDVQKETRENNTGGMQFDAEMILHGIQSTRSLKSLKLQRVMNTDWSLLHIFEAIRNCPSFRHLEVQDRPIAMQGLEEVVSMKPFDRPLQFTFPVDKYLKEHANAVEVIQGFLCKHPEIRLQRPCIVSKRARNKRFVHSHFTGGGASERFMNMMEDSLFVSKSFKHQWDFNWHGRYLMHRQDVPLGLWSQVLERATRNPSLIYEFLQSPALVSWSGAANT